MSDERLFLDNLELIESVIVQTCRRHFASDDETEEFRSLAHIKLIDNEYGVLRAFGGRSTLRGYLAIVLEREFLDYRNGKWGKWRPSMEASRLGEIAILLERLIMRDRFTFDEAVQILWTNHRVTDSRESLWAMWQRFPGRADRRPEPEQKLAYVPDPGPLPDELILASEKDDERRRAYDALAAAVALLEPEDRLIVKLQYFDGLKIVEIARALQFDPKRLYRRCEQILHRLRRDLEADGIDLSVLDGPMQ